MENHQLYTLSKEFTGVEATKDIIDKTYNKFLNHYRGLEQLGFEISCFPIEEQNSLLIEILKLKERERDFLSTKTLKKKYPNRRLIDNLLKDDLELDKEELIDYFIEKGNANSTFRPNLSSFNEVLSIDYQNKEMIKQSIRYSGESYTESYKKPYFSVLNYANSVEIEFNQFENIGIRNLKHEILVADLIEESYTYLFLQSIIYQIIKNPYLNKEQRLKYLVRLNKKLELSSCDGDFDNDLKYDNIFISFAVYLSKIRKRDNLKNYIDIITLLEKEIEEESDLFGNVQEPFKCKQRWLRDIETKKELISIVLEGKQEKVERFNKKAEKCKEAIVILRNIAGRDLIEDYLQHFKVVYREIFVSKVKSSDKDGKTANTIVSDMVNEENAMLFSRYVDSIFLREKLNRGFFREDGLIEEYKVKNKIQKNLYSILLNIYSRVDVKYQRKTIQAFYRAVFNGMMDILGEIDKATSLKE